MPGVNRKNSRSVFYRYLEVMSLEMKLEHPRLGPGCSDLDGYLRDSGSEVFFGDFWFKYATIF